MANFFSQFQLGRDQLRFLARTLAANQKGRLTLQVSRHDEGAMDFAREMLKVLRDAGWRVEWRTVLTPVEETGIVLKLRDPSDYSEANSVLIESLDEIGLKPTLVKRSELQQQEAVLVIGSTGSIDGISNPSSSLPEKSSDSTPNTPITDEPELQAADEVNQTAQRVADDIDRIMARQAELRRTQQRFKETNPTTPVPVEPGSVADGVFRFFGAIQNWLTKARVADSAGNSSVPEPAEPPKVDQSLSLDDTIQKPKELSLGLEDDAGGAMRDPDPDLAKESPLTSTELSHKLSWINRIPVWKEFGHWLKWASFFVFVVALGATQIGEYLVAELALIATLICCLVQIQVWTKPPKRYPRITKFLLAVLSVVLIGIGAWDIWKIKGDKSWSNLLSQERRSRDAKSQEIAQSPTGFLQFDRIEIRQETSYLAAGKQFGGNFYSRNPGPTRVFNAYGYSKSFVMEVGDDTDRLVQSLFEQQIRAIREDYLAGKIKGPEQGIGQGLWTTVLTEPLTQEQVDGILKGTVRIYFVTWLAWSDQQGGKDFSYDCRWLQGYTLKAPYKEREIVWHYCQ